MPILLGHRGARATLQVPENTIASFDLSLKHGCDGFEFDVRQSSDGQAVICHDPKSRRRTISRTTRVELSELPTLQEVLQRYGNRAFLDIELKVAGLEEQTLAALRDSSARGGYVISSFLPEVVAKLNALDPRAPLGIICGNHKQLSRWRELPVRYLIVEKQLLQKKLVEAAHEAAREIFVWTVNRRSSILRFASFGVDGIISDDTALLASTRVVSQ